MGEFQKKKAHEDLLSALGNMGLRVSPELNPGTDRSTAMGPGGTAPASWGEIAGLAPDYLPPSPAEAVPSEPLDPPPAND
ncbi:MAG TPA: hypothetical protein VHI31_06050 [Actinomycetota bacterium]|nr:hypothetical protein [Actinomycetota bacterium]